MPGKPILSPETFGDLTFPVKGLDLGMGFGQQRPGTTPLASNVRAYEPNSARPRGGSRPGLQKYLSDTLPGVVQDLDYVVLPAGSAQGISFTDTPILDPLFQLVDPSGFTLGDGTINWVFVGGSGYYTPKTYIRQHPPAAGWVFIQGNQSGFTNSAGQPLTLNFTSAVASGNLLLVAVTNFSAAGVSSVTDSLGHTYAEVPNHGFSGNERARLFYVVSHHSGSNTVSVTMAFDDYTGIAVLEYSGNASTPLDDSEGDGSSTTGDGLHVTTSTVAVNNSGELLIGVFGQGDQNVALTLDTGFVMRCHVNDGGSFEAIYVADKIGVSSGLAVTGTWADGLARAWVGVGASFKGA